MNTLDPNTNFDVWLIYLTYRYVTDVDCHAILAIIATASHSQAGYLRDFIFRHLTQKAFFQVHMPVGLAIVSFSRH